MTIQLTKKLTSILLLFVCVVLLFAGCANEKQENNEYTETIDGQEITISFNQGTKSEGVITSENGDYVFSYSFDGTLTIVYPNGYIYSQRSVNGGTVTSWDYNEDAEDLGFIIGYALAWSIESASRVEPSNAKTVSPILSILIVAVGAWLVWKPKTAWWLARGWMFKNVEPSDLALGIYRGIGIVIVIIGAISFFA